MRGSAERQPEPEPKPGSAPRRRLGVRLWSRLGQRLRGDRDEIVPAAYYLVARQGFPDDDSLAEALRITTAELAEWKCGHLDAESERLLRDLSVTVSELLTVYEPDVIPDWLSGKAPDELKTPLEWLREGNLAEVLHLINVSVTGAYS